MRRLAIEALVVVLCAAACPAQGRHSHGDFLGDVRIMVDEGVPTRRGNAGARPGVAGTVPGAEPAAALGELGVNFARVDAPYFDLAALEPTRAGGADRFAPLDATLRHLGEAGVKDIWFCLRTRSPRLGVGFDRARAGYPGFPIAEAARPEFARFVRALVERYDGDGVDDAAVAGARIVLLEVDPDLGWPEGFAGDAEAWLEILQIVRDAAKAAAPGIQILPGAFHCGFLFDEAPRGDARTRALIAANPGLKAAVAFQGAVLDRHELIDGVVVSVLGNYYSAYGVVPFYRQLLRDRGESKPIYVAPLLSGSLRLPLGGLRRAPSRTRAGALVNSIRSGNASRVAWWRRFQAAESVKKMVVATHLGVRRYAIGFHAGWPFATHLPPGDNTLDLCGLLELEEARSHADTAFGERTVAARTTAFTAVARTARALARFSTVELMSGPPNTFAFRFQKGREPFWIVWGEDGVGQAPGQAGMTVQLSLEVPENAELLITDLAAPAESFRPTEREARAAGTTFDLTVGEDPVLIEILSTGSWLRRSFSWVRSREHGAPRFSRPTRRGPRVGRPAAEPRCAHGDHVPSAEKIPALRGDRVGSARADRAKRQSAPQPTDSALHTPGARARWLEPHEP